MKRRDFFKTTVIGGAVLTVPTLASCALEPEKQKFEKWKVDFEYDELTIAQFHEKLKKGELSVRRLTDLYLQRINALDKSGPQLNAVIEINPEAQMIADERDEELRNGKVRGPLHGVPVLIKDNIDTGDKMQTTAGSLALAGFFAEKDAPLVARLREAGAVLLGKTNLSEWANFRSTRSSSGWSGRGGQTLNPYVIDRSPCGSSSGSGVAVAANLCLAAIGTETDGSIVCPSGISGIVGIKPTVGRWSGHGIIPISKSQDTAGPMTRSVEDAFLLLRELSDAAPAFVNENWHFDGHSKLERGALKGARIGVARQYFGFHPKVDKHMETAIAVLRSLGAEIIDPVDFKNFGEAGQHEWHVLLYEFKAGLADYFSQHPHAPIKNLEEMIAFNMANELSEMPWFGQEIAFEAQKKGDLNSPEYLEALAKCKQLTREGGIDLVMHTHRLDAIIAPTNGPAWNIDWVNGDHFGGGSSDYAAISGYPSITVPAGQVNGLPVGISFFGRAWSEQLLINLAFDFEQETNHRKKPRFLNHPEPDLV
jgi:amidase